MIQVNSDRLWDRIERLSRITDPERPWTRRAFDVEFAQGREWLTQEFRAAGLAVRIDAGGNLIGRLSGSAPDAGALIAGSHSDTVPAGGRFDGMLGLLAALEVAQSIHEQHIELLHPLEVVDFLAEEPSDFGISCIGSRSWAGVLTEADLARSLPGTTLAAEIDRAGGNTRSLHEPIRRSDSVAAYVELHIEQGLVLTEAKVNIGVVTAIVGIRRYTVTVSGRADHAGTTPMALRKDALAGAAEVIGAVERLARERGSAKPYLVATVGRIAVEPNAINAVPGLVNMILEIRSTHEGTLDQFEWELQFRVEGELRKRGLRYTISELSRTAPTACSALIQDAIEKAASIAQCTTMRLPSGAGHDGVYVARLAPMGMIFIPCRDGRSHAPEEWAEPHDCAKGARVLAETLLSLDRTLPRRSER